jgi:hypothetical protein
MKKIIAILSLVLVFVSCGGASLGATGRWQSPTTASGYLWLRLTDNTGSISGSLGTSSSATGLPLSGTRTGTYLDLTSINTGGNFYFEGDYSGDTWQAITTVCSSSCSTGTITFKRTSYTANTTLELQGSQEFKDKLIALIQATQTK